MEEAASAMAQVETMRSTGSTTVEADILGNSFSYQFITEGQSRMESGKTVEAVLETSVSGSGVQPAKEKIYFSPTEYGIYDEASQQWS